jgi:hypothetical protein
MKAVYVVNRAIDPYGDIEDIRIALQFTPLYCVLISSVYDMLLAHRFAEPGDILQVTGDVLELARDYADQSDMAVLIIGDAERLDVVKEDGSRESLCSKNE